MFNMQTYKIFYGLIYAAFERYLTESEIILIYASNIARYVEFRT